MLVFFFWISQTFSGARCGRQMRTVWHSETWVRSHKTSGKVTNAPKNWNSKIDMRSCSLWKLKQKVAEFVQEEFSLMSQASLLLMTLSQRLWMVERSPLRMQISRKIYLERLWTTCKFYRWVLPATYRKVQQARKCVWEANYGLWKALPHK